MATKQDDYIKTALRLPRELHAELMAAAEREGRSLNSEIISRLQRTLVELGGLQPEGMPTNAQPDGRVVSPSGRVIDVQVKSFKADLAQILRKDLGDMIEQKLDAVVAILTKPEEDHLEPGQKEETKSPGRRGRFTSSKITRHQYVNFRKIKKPIDDL